MDSIGNPEYNGSNSALEKSLWEKYRDADLEEKKTMFKDYLTEKISDNTINSYLVTFRKQVRGIIKDWSDEYKFVYEILDPKIVEQIWRRAKNQKENVLGHNQQTSSLKYYQAFLEYLQTPQTKSSDITNNVASPEEPYAMSIPVKQTNRANVKPFSIQRIITLIDQTGLLYSSKLVKRFAFSLMSKQFVILSGLAGSGKTQLALAFANMLIEDDSQMCVVPVGADWTNREPLLGFPNALQENVYVKPESGVLDLLIQANKTENADKPYFLILDEMNMSYVERYFADFLSAMESHKRIPLWCGDDGVTPTSIGLPQNLFIIGTINVDETTYMFSPKVLDRANVIEFKITGEEMSRFLSDLKPIDRDAVNYAASDMGAAFVACAKNKTVAVGSSEIRDALIQFFDDLKAVNAEFGYRSATEIYRFISQAIANDDTEDKMSLSDIIDCAIVQKLLPKLHGSRKKLNDALNALWKECFDDAVDKQTLYITKENVDRAKFRLTADKLQRMYDAALANGFTSFAEA